jgi:DNA-binding IclR family transcriptional regulator
LTQPLVENELRFLAATHNPHASRSMREVAKLSEEIRRHGLSRSAGYMLPGVDALGAPIFDHTGQLVAVIGVLGYAGLMDSRLDGEVANFLRETCGAISARLGYTPGN